MSVDPNTQIVRRQWPIGEPNQPKLLGPVVLPATSPRPQPSTASSARPARIFGGAVRKLAPTAAASACNSFAVVEDSSVRRMWTWPAKPRLPGDRPKTNVSIPKRVEIGYDADLDRSRGFNVTAYGITIIAKSDGADHFPEADV